MPEETLEISFPGGKKVDAKIGDHLIRTDQSLKGGGGATAPEPFDLFLASIGTCAGIFALGFCQSRDIPTEGLKLRMVCEKDEAHKLFTKMRFHLELPPGFPDKYRKSIEKAIGLCAVKRHIDAPDAPNFEVVFDN